MKSSASMTIKVQFEQEIHRTSKVPATFEGLKSYVSEAFVKLPRDWHLQYPDPKDPEGFKISISSEEDYNEFRSSSSGKVTKVYVVSAEAFQKPRVPNSESSLAVSEYQAVENLGNGIRIEEWQNSVVEEVGSQVLVNNKVSAVASVSEKPESEKKESQQEVEENKDEKGGKFYLNPRKNKNLIEKDENHEILMKKFNSAIAFAESQVYERNNNNKEEQKAVVEKSAPEIPANNNNVVIVSEKKEEEEKGNFDQGQPKGIFESEEYKKQGMVPLIVELDDALGLIENLKSKVENASNTVVGINRHYKLGLSQVEVASKKEGKRGCLYFKTLHEKARELQRAFPQKDFDMLCAYVDEAPEDLTIEELIENYKH